METRMRLICMSFDGDFQAENPIFTEVDEAWSYSNDLGSKWYFYPWHFVVTDTTKTIVAAPHGMEALVGKRTATVVRLFNALHQELIAKNEQAGVDKFHALICRMTDTIEKHLGKETA